MSHPESKIPRTYHVSVEGIPSFADLQKIRCGMDIGKGEHSQPANVKLLGPDSSTATLEITLTEGKNREIRRIFEQLGTPVRRLVRIRFGPFRLDGLASGRYKRIEAKWELF